MAINNSITLVGNITDDPELRFTPAGAAVANFTVAVNRRQPAQGGGWEDKLDGFFRCNCWREMAENAAESLQKGMRVMVVGRLQQRSWEDQEGNRRVSTEIVARHLVLLGSKEEGNKAETATARPEGKASLPKAAPPRPGKASAVEEPEDYLGVPEEDIPF